MMNNDVVFSVMDDMYDVVVTLDYDGEELTSNFNSKDVYFMGTNNLAPISKNEFELIKQEVNKLITEQSFDIIHEFLANRDDFYMYAREEGY